MEIGPADAHSLDPDLHFARSGIFNRHVSEPECQGSDEFRGSHRMIFHRNDTPAVGRNKRRADCDPSGGFRLCCGQSFSNQKWCNFRIGGENEAAGAAVATVLAIE